MYFLVLSNNLSDFIVLYDSFNQVTYLDRFTDRSIRFNKYKNEILKCLI